MATSKTLLIGPNGNVPLTKGIFPHREGDTLETIHGFVVHAVGLLPANDLYAARALDTAAQLLEGKKRGQLIQLMIEARGKATLPVRQQLLNPLEALYSKVMGAKMEWLKGHDNEAAAKRACHDRFNSRIKDYRQDVDDLWINLKTMDQLAEALDLVQKLEEEMAALVEEINSYVYVPEPNKCTECGKSVEGDRTIHKDCLNKVLQIKKQLKLAPYEEKLRDVKNAMAAWADREKAKGRKDPYVAIARALGDDVDAADAELNELWKLHWNQLKAANERLQKLDEGLDKLLDRATHFNHTFYCVTCGVPTFQYVKDGKLHNPSGPCYNCRKAKKERVMREANFEKAIDPDALDEVDSMIGVRVIDANGKVLAAGPTDAEAAAEQMLAEVEARERAAEYEERRARQALPDVADAQTVKNQRTFKPDEETGDNVKAVLPDTKKKGKKARAPKKLQEAQEAE